MPHGKELAQLPKTTTSKNIGDNQKSKRIRQEGQPTDPKSFGRGKIGENG
ncbi:hypothetical protein OEV98_14360 [Caldibacillus lycopersici]|uniref:Uncharacterized protein n=1 Tax=Perspicuibacillus lycopersici TaxID=1325689 RepID=A0AAE3IU99_9BACI|nr:hypothetical protein [Perspicuibacillus lycopersici]MCU9614723.1 hypothetical protein [Perspicuibacillus lycopersici]